jgi:hypothetical protein
VANKQKAAREKRFSTNFSGANNSARTHVTSSGKKGLLLYFIFIIARSYCALYIILLTIASPSSTNRRVASKRSTGKVAPKVAASSSSSSTDTTKVKRRSWTRESVEIVGDDGRTRRTKPNVGDDGHVTGEDSQASARSQLGTDRSDATDVNDNDDEGDDDDNTNGSDTVRSDAPTVVGDSIGYGERDHHADDFIHHEPSVSPVARKKAVRRTPHDADESLMVRRSDISLVRESLQFLDSQVKSL